jgi:catechol 2,3-dioxygenase
LDAGVDIGHVHLKGSDLDRSVAFYRDVLGLTVQGRMGDRAAFLSAGDEYTITSD